MNEAFVRRFFKHQNPIGQHFGMDRIQYAGSFEIVGVVRDMRYMTWAYKDPVRPMFWLPETQSVKYDDPQFNTFDLYSHFLDNIVIWAPGNPPAMEAEVRKALASIDPNLVVYGVNPYSEILAGDFQQENMIATLTMLFGVLGLVLAAVGLYGVMAYSVEQRTSEIGVRMALGADRSRVVRMVLRGAFSQIGIGLGPRHPSRHRRRPPHDGATLRRRALGSAHAHHRDSITLRRRARGILDPRSTRGNRRAYGCATH